MVGWPVSWPTVASLGIREELVTLFADGSRRVIFASTMGLETGGLALAAGV